MAKPREKLPLGLAALVLVAQVSNLPYRRFPIGRRSKWSWASNCRPACGLEIRDTAGWKPALRYACLHLVASVAFANAQELSIPARPANAPSGSTFLTQISDLDLKSRE